MTDIITIGEILIDLTQTGTNGQGVPLFAANPGGAPANVAVAAARLGASTAFIGKAGRDPFGNYLRRTLEQNDVDTTHLLIDRQLHTTLALVGLTADGERSFQFLRGADAALTEEEIPAGAVENAKLLHFGSVSLTALPARDATLSAVRRAREAGVLVSYDPNYRPALWDSEAEARDWMARPLPLADILKVSRDELSLLAGTEELEEGTRRMEALGIQLVLVTLGADGVLCRRQGRNMRVPGVGVQVADTNGAGDSFLGAVLSRLARREGRAPLEDLSHRELEDILSFANRAAAITCSRSGAIPALPRLDELGQ